MIIKVVPAPEGGGRFTGLAAYVTQAKRNHTIDRGGRQESWKGLGDYVIDATGGGEKVEAAWSRNCAGETLPDAIRLIEVTQRVAGNKARAQHGTTLHLVVSLAEGEYLDTEVMKRIEGKVLKAIGMETHQAISAVHRNTDNCHMHIAVSKIHPDTLRNITPYQAWPKLRAVCKELELEYGLKSTALTKTSEKYLSDAAKEMEIHQGQKSYTTWLRDKARADLLVAANTAAGWEDIHRAMARFGGEIKPRGAGLIIAHRTAKAYTVPASHVDRALSFKALTDRFGEYQAPSWAKTPDKAPGAEFVYTDEPIQQSQQAKELYDKFKSAKAAALAERQKALDAVKAQQQQVQTAWDDWYNKKEHFYKTSWLVFSNPKAEMRDAAQKRREALKEAREQKRRATTYIYETHKIFTWQNFLERQAELGNEAALGVLRETQNVEKIFGDTILTSPTAKEVRDVVKIGVEKQIRPDGSVIYHLRDGGIVIDTKGSVQVTKITRGAMEFGTELAEQKFLGRPLAFKAPAEAQEWAVQAAARNGALAQFQDPELERRRQYYAAINQQKTLETALGRAAASIGIGGRGGSTVTPDGVTFSNQAEPGTYTYGGTVEVEGEAYVLLKQNDTVSACLAKSIENDVLDRLQPGDDITIDERGNTQTQDEGYER